MKKEEYLLEKHMHIPKNWFNDYINRLNTYDFKDIYVRITISPKNTYNLYIYKKEYAQILKNAKRRKKEQE